MYYPFILYYNEYVFNLAAHKTPVKTLRKVFCLHLPVPSAEGRFCAWFPPHQKGKNSRKINFLFHIRIL